MNMSSTLKRRHEQDGRVAAELSRQVLPEGVEKNKGTLDLIDVSRSYPLLKVREKEEVLAKCANEDSCVVAIVGLTCDKDPAWALRVLLAAGPRLQEVRLEHALAPHLQALEDMAGLRRLHVSLGSTSVGVVARQRCALPASLEELDIANADSTHLAAVASGGLPNLRKLRVQGSFCALPEAAADADAAAAGKLEVLDVHALTDSKNAILHLIRANGASLSELTVSLSSLGPYGGAACQALVLSIAECGLKNLRRLDLRDNRCPKVCLDLWQALPWVTVVCHACRRA